MKFMFCIRCNYQIINNFGCFKSPLLINTQRKYAEFKQIIFDRVKWEGKKSNFLVFNIPAVRLGKEKQKLCRKYKDKFNYGSTAGYQYSTLNIYYKATK